MRLLNVDTLEEAREKLLQAAAGKTPDIERVPFAKSRGRILAEDLIARENIPDFRKSTVDGYAVRAGDTQGVTESIPVFLDVIEETEIGTMPEKRVESGQAVYVPTGGMLPEGADAMVMVEFCEKFDEKSIAVYDAVSPGRNVISVGEDVSAGQVFLKKGSVIRPQETGVLASAGVTEPAVFKPWIVSVISTGDELVDARETPAKGQTRDINTYSIAALSETCGFEILSQEVLKDDEVLLEKAVKTAMETSDLVVVSGGSSQGEKDHTADVLDRLSDGGVFTHGIALKPGKPTILGYDRASDTILAGLPGHPAAAVLVFELVIGWLYRRLTCQQERKKTFAKLTENAPAAGGKTTCLLVRLWEGGSETSCQGEDNGMKALYRAEPIYGKSGLMTTLTEADGYILIGMNQEGMKEGEIVQVHLF